ncbi:MAG: DUF3870 domain-containing protein [Anaerovorax sp.]|nr:DUF3870 domain-containing protein [Anaerovorax sp.]
MFKEYILITGYSHIQSGTTSAEQYGGYIVVSLEVERNSGVIINVDCSLTTELARDYIKRLLIGKNLLDFGTIERALKHNYFGVARKPVTYALRNCKEKFLDITENK